MQTLLGAPIGPNVLSDGSNISPQALTLMQKKLTNGQFLIPTQQTVDPTKPFALQGTSSFSSPCSYNEDQFVTNADFLHNEHNTFSVKFFWANDTQHSTFPATQLGGPTSPGFPTLLDIEFRTEFFNVFNHPQFADPDISFSDATFGQIRMTAVNPRVIQFALKLNF